MELACSKIVPRLLVNQADLQTLLAGQESLGAILSMPLRRNYCSFVLYLNLGLLLTLRGSKRVPSGVSNLISGMESIRFS